MFYSGNPILVNTYAIRNLTISNMERNNEKKAACVLPLRPLGRCIILHAGYRSVSGSKLTHSTQLQTGGGGEGAK